MQLAPYTEILAARRDRAAVFVAPSTDHQLALAMMDAAWKSSKHPIAESIGRVARYISEQEHNPIRKA